MHKAVFSVRLNSEQVLDFYKGTKSSVKVRTECGQTMSIPYDIMVKFVTREGIYGRFQISYRDDGKMVDLIRL
ncbi:DUF2835 family protein [Endozoicomonas ascidiicola]|uniref:DUF2835 family protein n=1 Tax=Endozoicomonas ascidiicola TaxID=1698521 RepID=UPI00082BB078|nr:DUF2835 family protein [Endozoicomonas ascidiicola]